MVNPFQCSGDECERWARGGDDVTAVGEWGGRGLMEGRDNVALVVGHSVAV